MRRHQLLRYIIGLCLALNLLLFPAQSAYAAELMQRDWMVTLVDGLGLSYGLPDEPQDPDYINILAGNRFFRFEAEDIYNKETDNVSIMSFRNFGAFSGSGWLHGTREPTDVHLGFTLPLRGEYLIKALVRQPGHQFMVGDKTVTADAEPVFTEVEVGTFDLQAGPQELTVTLPPNGSIDYVSLAAPNLPIIAPEDGWQPDEPLTWEVVQTTLLQLFELAALFPEDPDPIVLEAEGYPQPGVQVVSIPHLGTPSGGKWLRTGPMDAEIRFPVDIPAKGFYDLSLRVMGNPIRVVVGDHQEINLAANPYLEDYLYTALYFQGSPSNISVTLPPGGGIDRLILTGRKTDPEGAQTLLDLDQGVRPSAADLDSITSLLAAFGIER